MIWLALVPLFAALVFIASRFHRLRHHYVQERSATHEAYLAALEEWIAQPEIVKVAVRAGILTESGLDLLQRQLVGAKSEAEVRALMCAFLQSRRVRQAVARHMMQRHGSDKRAAMQMLMGIADVGRS